MFEQIKCFTEVFVTKTCKFRVKYTVPSSFCNDAKVISEVSVGGKMWKSGKGSHAFASIKKSCENIIVKLLMDYIKNFIDLKEFYSFVLKNKDVAFKISRVNL